MTSSAKSLRSEIISGIGERRLRDIGTELDISLPPHLTPAGRLTRSRKTSTASLCDYRSTPEVLKVRRGSTSADRPKAVARRSSRAEILSITHPDEAPNRIKQSADKKASATSLKSNVIEQSDVVSRRRNKWEENDKNEESSAVKEIEDLKVEVPPHLYYSETDKLADDESVNNRSPDEGLNTAEKSDKANSEEENYQERKAQYNQTDEKQHIQNNGEDHTQNDKKQHSQNNAVNHKQNNEKQHIKNYVEEHTQNDEKQQPTNNTANSNQNDEKKHIQNKVGELTQTNEKEHNQNDTEQNQDDEKQHIEKDGEKYTQNNEKQHIHNDAEHNQNNEKQHIQNDQEELNQNNEKQHTQNNKEAHNQDEDKQSGQDSKKQEDKVVTFGDQHVIDFKTGDEKDSYRDIDVNSSSGKSAKVVIIAAEAEDNDVSSSKVEEVTKSSSKVKKVAKSTPKVQEVTKQSPKVKKVTKSIPKVEEVPKSNNKVQEFIESNLEPQDTTADSSDRRNSDAHKISLEVLLFPNAEDVDIQTKQKNKRTTAVSRRRRIPRNYNTPCYDRELMIHSDPDDDRERRNNMFSSNSRNQRRASSWESKDVRFAGHSCVPYPYYSKDRNEKNYCQFCDPDPPKKPKKIKRKIVKSASLNSLGPYNGMEEERYNAIMNEIQTLLEEVQKQRDEFRNELRTLASCLECTHHQVDWEALNDADVNSAGDDMQMSTQEEAPKPAKEEVKDQKTDKNDTKPVEEEEKKRQSSGDGGSQTPSTSATPEPGAQENGDDAPGTPKAPTLREQFRNFSRFGDTKSDGKHVTLSQSDKWFKQAKVIDGKTITTTDTAITFNKLKTKKITFVEFEKYLDEISKAKKIEVKDLKAKLRDCGSPAISGTTSVVKSSAVDRLTDTKKYTGSHKLRFDSTGRGKGIAGRKDIADTSGYVSGYKNKNSYDQTH